MRDVPIESGDAAGSNDLACLEDIRGLVSKVQELQKRYCRVL
jgi:hypothetical protein